MVKGVRLIPTPIQLTPGMERSYQIEELILTIRYDVPKKPTASKRIWFSVRSPKLGEKVNKRWLQTASILSKRVAHVHFEEDKGSWK